jgi:hypothetical protein
VQAIFVLGDDELEEGPPRLRRIWVGQLRQGGDGTARDPDASLD